MFVNLSKIRTLHEQYERVYAPEAFGPDQESYRIVDPVSLAFDIFKDKAQFRLAGHARTTLEMGCSRCLEPYRVPVDAAFDLRYQPHSTNTGEGEREIEEDDLSTAFYENDQIDLGQLMREQIYLALPMKPLCADECRGLCPVCGTNLSKGACSCTHEWEDPRLAVLKTFNTKSES